jgi:hypothetical protein
MSFSLIALCVSASAALRNFKQDFKRPKIDAQESWLPKSLEAMRALTYSDNEQY